MSILQQHAPRGRFPLFGLVVILALTGGFGAWVWADAADPTVQPPLATKGNVVVAASAQPLSPQLDPLVVVMDSWEETAAKNKNTASKKKKKKKNNFFDLYLFFYYYGLATIPNVNFYDYSNSYNDTFYNYYFGFYNYNSWFAM